VTSREDFVALQEKFLASFPDQHTSIRQIVAEGDRVAVLATYTGTQTGPLGDFPVTGKVVNVPFLAMFRIEGGKIAELWVEFDNVAIHSQLGLFPPPGAGE
jgi:predicted ester cyclase